MSGLHDMIVYGGGPLMVIMGALVFWQHTQARWGRENAVRLETEEFAALSAKSVPLLDLPAAPTDAQLTDFLTSLAHTVDAFHNNHVVLRERHRAAPIEGAQQILARLLGGLRQQALYPAAAKDSEAQGARAVLIDKLRAFTNLNGTDTNQRVVERINSALKIAVILYDKADKGCAPANPAWFNASPRKPGQERAFLMALPKTYNFDDDSCSPQELAACIDRIAHSISACLAMAVPHQANYATHKGPKILLQLAAVRDTLLANTRPDFPDLIRRALKRLPKIGTLPTITQDVEAHVRVVEIAFSRCFAAAEAPPGTLPLFNLDPEDTPQIAPAPAPRAAAPAPTPARAPNTPAPALSPEIPVFVLPSTVGLPPLDALRVVAAHLLNHPQAAARTFGAGILPPLAQISGWLDAHPHDEHRVAALVDAAAPRAVKTLGLYARLALVPHLNAADRRSLADAESALAELPRLLAAYHRALLSSDFRQLDLLVREMRVIDLQLDAPSGYAQAEQVPA